MLNHDYSYDDILTSPGREIGAHQQRAYRWTARALAA